MRPSVVVKEVDGRTFFSNSVRQSLTLIGTYAVGDCVFFRSDSQFNIPLTQKQRRETLLGMEVRFGLRFQISYSKKPHGTMHVKIVEVVPSISSNQVFSRLISVRQKMRSSETFTKSVS